MFKKLEKNGYAGKGTKTPQGLPATYTCGTVNNKDKHAPTHKGKGRLKCILCPRCYSSMTALFEHFPHCVAKYGNPNGACWDAHPSANLAKELAFLEKAAKAAKATRARKAGRATYAAHGNVVKLEENAIKLEAE